MRIGVDAGTGRLPRGPACGTVSAGRRTCKVFATWLALLADLVRNRSRRTEFTAVTFACKGQVAILSMFLGISASLFPLSAWDDMYEVGREPRSRGLSVRFHDGHQEREIEARIDYSNVVEEFYPDDETWKHVKEGQRSTVISGPFRRLDSTDKLEFNGEGVFFNGAEVPTNGSLKLEMDFVLAKTVGRNVELHETWGGSHIRDFKVCFSVMENRLEAWSAEAGGGRAVAV